MRVRRLTHLDMINLTFWQKCTKLYPLRVKLWFWQRFCPKKYKMYFLIQMYGYGNSSIIICPDKVKV